MQRALSRWDLGPRRARAVISPPVALQPIPLGGPVRWDMVAEVDTVPEGDELVVVVPLDLSLVTEGVSERDLVLLGRPRGRSGGAEASAPGPGRMAGVTALERGAGPC